MKKLVLYGDSNTYGYDPRGFMGMRYPAEIRWADTISRKLENEYIVINEGMNGRPMPDIRWDEPYLKALTGDLDEGDILLMMLGTNDILLTARPDAGVALDKLKNLLSYSGIVQGDFKFIVVAPPYIGSGSGDMRRYHEESIKMNAGMKGLCEAKKICFIDSGKWDLPLAYDMAHLSEEGHGSFAEHILEELKKLKCIN